METIPCPGCRTALEPSATVCPICLRPRGKIEITRAFAALREQGKRRRRRPFVVAAYAAAAASAGGLVYRFHAPAAAFAVSARARAGQFVASTLDSAVPAPRPAPAPPSPPPEPVASAPSPGSEPPASPARVPVPAADAPRPPAPAVPPPRLGRVEDLPFPRIDPGSQWIVYGRVYDLSTLRPVARARLDFTVVSDGGSAGLAEGAAPFSDQDGRYLEVLRRLPEGSSYEIHSQGAGYASAALYESDIPYAQLSPSDRRDIVQNARDGDVPLPPLTDIAGVNSVRRDVFLAPNP